RPGPGREGRRPRTGPRRPRRRSGGECDSWCPQRWRRDRIRPAVGTQALFALQIRLDRALQLDRQGLALAIDAIAEGQAHPALRDAVFLDVGLVLALEAHAHAARQKVAVV